MTRFKCLKSARRCLFAALIAGPVDAATGLPGDPPAAAWDGDFQVHGFVTQGYVQTSSNRFFGDSDDGSTEFTELGLNASYRITPHVLLAGQLLSRRAGDMYNGSPTVDYALIDWNLVDQPDYAIGVQLGRVKNTLGFYNETRDVAFTRPSIFLPQQIYFDSVRNLFLSADSLHLYGRLNNALGNWSWNLGVGTAPLDKNVEISYLGTDFGGDLEVEGASYVVQGMYESHGAAWRAALSVAQAELGFDAAPNDPVGSGTIDFLYWIASLQYNAERWSLTVEYMQEPVDFSAFGPLIDGRDSTVQGYYLQASYLLRDDLELLLRYAEGYTDKDDRSGKAAAAASGGVAPPHSFLQKDWMLGLRWDLTPNWMIRAEYQWADGAWTLSRRENPDPAAMRRGWEMFSLLASYRF